MNVTEKPVKYTVAVVIRSGHRPGKFLVVKRPSGDKDLAGSWGLPAVTLQPYESPEDGARRACFEKLGCRAEPIRFLGAMHQQRNEYDIVLMDIEVMLLGAALPNVKHATSSTTTYVTQKWTHDPKVLLPSAQHGSCCSSIFLADQGVITRDAWKRSLVGSTLVG